MMVLISHVVFAIFAASLVWWFYGNGSNETDAKSFRTVMSAFARREGLTLFLCGYAAIFTPGVMEQMKVATIDGLSRAFPKSRLVVTKVGKGKEAPSDAPARNGGLLWVTRWIALWVGITAGFAGAGVLIEATGGYNSSAFVQLPFTMVILGALMSNNGRTAFAVFAYGVGYAAILIFDFLNLDSVLFGSTALKSPSNPTWVAFSITVANAAIGVAATYLGREGPPENVASKDQCEQGASSAVSDSIRAS